MDSIGGIAWNVRAPEAVRAELVRRYPQELSASIDALVPHIVGKIERAWRCYLPRHPHWDEQGRPPAPLPGAAAALFDVVRVLRMIQLPLPDDVQFELEALARSALAGEGVRRGQGASSPLEAHRKALRKRWRCAWVTSIILEGMKQRLEDELVQDPAYGSGISQDIWEEHVFARKDMAEEVVRACKLAQHYSGDKSTQWRAFYDDYREVVNFTKEDIWPGVFYITSEETCDELGWDFANQMACDFTGRDAPLFMVRTPL